MEFHHGPCPTQPSLPPAGAGGQAVFVGHTRAESHPKHGALRSLHYTAHEPLALAELARIEQHAIDTHGLLQVRVVHALGDVPVGEASVVIDVHAAHRVNAFAGCRAIIDALKASAPIFKHERWATGDTWAPGTPAPGASNAT